MAQILFPLEFWCVKVFLRNPWHDNQKQKKQKNLLFPLHGMLKSYLPSS